VLDPFCGCGTTIAASQKLNRRWIGIDITNLAITLIRGRSDGHIRGRGIRSDRRAGIRSLMRLRWQRPIRTSFSGGRSGWSVRVPSSRRRARIVASTAGSTSTSATARRGRSSLSVKAGHVNVSHVRDLRGVLDREQADMGVLISLEDPTVAAHEGPRKFGPTRFDNLMAVSASA
jgi:site-specific DNA-methyltransferase (adenine-specific)